MSKNTGMVTALCRQTTIPKGATIIRIPGTGNARPSAIAPPFIKPPLNWATQPAVNQQLLPADEAVAIVTNDPLHAVIFTDKNPTGAGLQQRWLFGGSPDQPDIVLNAGSRPPLATDLYCSIPDPGFRQWHGGRLHALRWKGKYYMWCDGAALAAAGNLINVALAAASPGMLAGDAVIINVYRLAEGDEIQTNSVRVAGPIAPNTIVSSFTIPMADWYRVELAADEDNATNGLLLNIFNTAVSEILVHLALPDLVERMMPLVQSIRILGASVHGINLVSDQNATGSWVGDQPEGSILYTSFLRGAAGANGFQKLTTSRGNELMELKKFNPYAWVAPESEKSWSYRQPFTFTAGGQVSNTLGDDANSYDYVVIYFKAGGVQVGVGPFTPDPARNIQLEFFFAVEYLSEGLWMMPGVSPATNDDEDAARKVLNSMENIGHNPAFDEIMRTIGKYVRLSPPVLSLLGPYGKAAAAVATGVGEGLRLLGYRTKKTARPEGHPGHVGSGEERQAKARRVAHGEEEGDEEV